MVRLEDYDLNKLLRKNPYPTILLVGKRFSGKSVKSAFIAEHFPYIEQWLAWGGNEDAKGYWAKRFGSYATCYGSDEKGLAKIRSFCEEQDMRVKYYDRNGLPWPEKYSTGLIFDDMTSKKKFAKCDILEELFSNGRHFKCPILITCQYINQLPPAVRSNADIIIIMYNSKSVLEKLHEGYVTVPHEFKLFRKLVYEVTEQRHPFLPDPEDPSKKMKLYNGLVFDNTVQSEALHECFSVMRSPIPDKNKPITLLGSQAWRDYNHKHFHDVDLENMQMLAKRKQKEQRLRDRELRHQAQLTGLSDTGIRADYFNIDDEEDDEDDIQERHDFELKHRNTSFNISMKQGFLNEDLSLQNQMKQQYPTQTAQQPPQAYGYPAVSQYGTQQYGSQQYPGMQTYQIGSSYPQPQPVSQYAHQTYPYNGLQPLSSPYYPNLVSPWNPAGQYGYQPYHQPVQQHPVSAWPPQPAPQMSQYQGSQYQGSQYQGSNYWQQQARPAAAPSPPSYSVQNSINPPNAISAALLGL